MTAAAKRVRPAAVPSLDVAPMPPHDLDAEGAVLSAVMLDPSALAKVPELRPEHFYSEAHRRIFEACIAVAANGEPLDAVTVHAWLKSRGRVASVGGMGYLAEILAASPVVANVSAHAETVLERWRRRDLLARTRRVVAGLEVGQLDADQAGERIRQIGEGAAVRAERSPSYVIESPAEIAEPLPPLAWVCRGMRIARASLTIFGGYGYSRKTLTAQDLALSVATGTSVLGVYRCERRAVAHVDYEQGPRITRERYQRLARARGVDLRDAALSVVTFPRFRMSDSDARDVVRRLLDETQAGLVIVDSLRASVSGIDENSSEIREYLDLLGQEAKARDAAAIVIHHARKPSEGKGGGKFSLRGSSAIFDACDGVFVFGGEKGQPTLVEHEKDRLIGEELAAFGLGSEDVEQDGDPRWGLRLVHMEGEQMQELAADEHRATKDAALGRTANEIRQYLASRGGSVKSSKNELRATLGCNRDRFFGAVALLEQSGELIAEGPQRAQTLRLRGQP